MGTVAGLLTLAMLIYMIRPMRHDGSVSLTQAAVTAVLGLGAFGFTVPRALNGAASVNTSTTAVHVHSTLWPAYAGIAHRRALDGPLLVPLGGRRLPVGVDQDYRVVSLRGRGSRHVHGRGRLADTALDAGNNDVGQRLSGRGFGEPSAPSEERSLPSPVVLRAVRRMPALQRS